MYASNTDAKTANTNYGYIYIVYIRVPRVVEEINEYVFSYDLLFGQSPKTSDTWISNTKLSFVCLHHQ